MKRFVLASVTLFLATAFSFSQEIAFGVKGVISFEPDK